MSTLSQAALMHVQCDFGCMISDDEILQIRKRKLSVVCARTGFCHASYMLRRAPRLFASCRGDGRRVAVVYPATATECETLVVLEAKTGKVEREFVLKNIQQSFVCIALGTQLLFVVNTLPNIVFFAQFGEAQKMGQYEFQSPVVFLAANATEHQFLVVRKGKHLNVIKDLDEKAGPKAGLELHGFQMTFTFLVFSGDSVVFGTPFGEVNFMSSETGQYTKTVKTPHGSKAVGCTDTYGVTKDGIVFAVETGQGVSNAFDPVAIYSSGATVVVFGKSDIRVFETAKMPICTTHSMQPPEPFVAAEFSVDPAVMFAAPNAVYGFNVSGKDISRFAPLQEKVTKIVTCQACVSMMYSTSEGDRIMTFVTGTKKRDEFGIDVVCDKNNRTWILQKDCVYAFERSLLELKQVMKIDNLPQDHKFKRIFRMGSTIGLYSPEGIAAYYNTQKNAFVSFAVPRDLSIIQWPALCTKDRLFICTKDTEAYDQLNQSQDYIFVDAEITSCCWLGRTLFAVQGSTVYAIGQKNGKMRPVDSLPNVMCVIAAALPSELIFVTSLPDLHTIVYKGPYLAHFLYADMDPSDLQAFKYMLYHMPSMITDPKSLSSLQPLYAMSIFNKAHPKYVDDFVIHTYCRFARFMELRNLAKKGRNSKDTLTKIADTAINVGQFEIARGIYEEIGDFDSLFEIFVVLNDTHNLRVLAGKSYLAQCIDRFFRVQPIDDEYRPVANLQLPRIRQLITGDEFVLYAGDPSEAAPILSPAFDEIDDCSVNHYFLSGEEADEVAAAALDQMETPEVEETPEAPGEPEQAQTQPEATQVHVEHTPPKEQEEEKSSLSKWFDDDDDEEDKKLTIDLKMNNRGPKVGFALEGMAPAGGRRRTIAARPGRRSPFSLNDSLPATSKEAPEPTIPSPLPNPSSEASQFATMGVVPADPPSTAPETDEHDGQSQNPADQYRSTLFLD